jgi:hypothetical protein
MRGASLELLKPILSMRPGISGVKQMSCFGGPAKSVATMIQLDLAVMTTIFWRPRYEDSVMVDLVTIVSAEKGGDLRGGKSRTGAEDGTAVV